MKTFGAQTLKIIRRRHLFSQLWLLLVSRYFDQHPGSHTHTHTHRPRAWIWDSPFILHPAVIGTLFVGEGPIKGGSDGRHRVDADGRASEDGAFKRKKGEEVSFGLLLSYNNRPLSLITSDPKLNGL